LIKVTELPPGETFRDARSLLARVGLSVLRGSDRIVAVSQAIAATLLAAGVPEERIAEIANGVDCDRFRPATDEERARLRAELSWPLDAPVVLCCGVLSRRKNAIAVVRALGHVGAEAVTLVLAGPDDPELGYRRELEAAVSRLPRAVRVEWTGRLDAEELSRVMRGADVLALTSRFEGLPNVLLEALASGLACVATDIPGCRDALEDGAGVLVPEDDDDALAEVLGRLLTDAEERRALAAEGCRRAREQYSFERVADRYRAVYDELVPEDR
jgi:glycosyltransferase involved in cell wall biosynthesis